MMVIILLVMVVHLIVKLSQDIIVKVRIQQNQVIALDALTHFVWIAQLQMNLYVIGVKRDMLFNQIIPVLRIDAVINIHME